MENLAIKVNGVSKKLRANQALNNVSLEFDSGMMHGLIGPEGAGKTTLLRTLLGLLRPDQGKIQYLVNGLPVDFASIRPLVAYMPQQQSLYGDLSIEEHLDFFRELYGISEDEYQKKKSELLHITRLDKFVERSASQLSGGMYKKLGLMCALLRSPRVLLLDEPTNGVDPISRREFWELLYTLASDQVLIIVATAYMDEAKRCARVHRIDSGRCLNAGEPRSLLASEGVANFDAYFIKHAGEDKI